MKILSWNVNGIRAREKAGLIDLLAREDADIVCLQEVRAQYSQLSTKTRDWFNNNYILWGINTHDRAGYSGVLYATRIPLNDQTAIKYRFDQGSENDENGREIILDFDKFSLITVYTPNAGRELDKIVQRVAWENDFRDCAREYYLSQKPLIICGDMNVAPEKIDCNVYSKAGTSAEERLSFSTLKQNCGLIDVYREQHPGEQGFTWFSNMYDGRAANKGMRIDHFLISSTLNTKEHNVNMQVLSDKELSCGSDHSPIVLNINL